MAELERGPPRSISGKAWPESEAWGADMEDEDEADSEGNIAHIDEASIEVVWLGATVLAELDETGAKSVVDLSSHQHGAHAGQVVFRRHSQPVHRY